MTCSAGACVESELHIMVFDELSRVNVPRPVTKQSYFGPPYPTLVQVGTTRDNSGSSKKWNGYA